MSRNLHKIDATNQVVGRLATEVANLLRGKYKTTYEPRIDDGDIVEISNVAKIKFTGKKLEDKVYHHHTGFPGGIRTVSAKKLSIEKPSELLKRAVYKMLPRNKHREAIIKRLHFVK